MVPAPVELVWQRTQQPDLHVMWDIRFNTIRYLDEKDQRGFNLMDYRTRIGFGIGSSRVRALSRKAFLYRFPRLSLIPMTGSR